MNAPKASWSFQNTSLEQSFLWSLAITALPVITGFVVSWVIARWAGPTVIGTVSWVMSFATTLLILAKFGLDLATSRLASEYGVKSPGKLRALFRVGFGLRAAFTVFVSLLALGLADRIASFFNDPGLTAPIRAGAVIVVCASFYEFKENFLIGLNRLPTVYKIRSLHLSLRIAATALLVLTGAGATAILGGYCTAWLVAIAAYGLLLYRYLPRAEPLEGPDDHLGRLFRMSLALAVSGASVTIYSHMDRLILGYFSGVAEVGQYTVARNITEVSLFPVFAAMMMLRPALASRYSSGSVDECSTIIRKTLRFAFVSGILFCAIFAALGLPLVTLVFSDTFAYSGRLLVFFVWVIALRSLGAVILPALIAAERTRLYAYLTTISAAVYFVLSMILVPRYASRGAIAATAISYALILLLGLREVFSIYRVRIGWRPVSLFFRTILAGAVAGGTTGWLVGHPPANWTVVPWTLLLSGLYLVLIFILRVSSFREIGSLLTNLKQTNH
jgi:O-antigen/teichoic acid export membrane protein